ISKFDAMPARSRANPSSFLTIQEGCDKFCTYCVVPYTRGAEVSRPWADIVTEAQALVEGRAREIVLLGQNVNAWADGNRGLADLIRALAKIDGLERIRYTTSHPADMTDALIAAHGEVEKLMPYLHLPVQSGSNRILRAMNRSHTTETYLTILDKMRAARRDIAISGDFIVGFPGETDEDFEATLSIVDAVGYASAYSFKYSPRPGTPAATMEDQIPREIMDERLQRLQARIWEHSLAFNRSKVGSDTQLLIERKGRRPGQMIGRSPWMQSVHLETDAQRLGVHISARGKRVQIEGDADSATRARDVLTGLYSRLDHGQDVDAEAVDAVLGMAAQPSLDGIIQDEVTSAPRVMIRTRKKTIVPRSPVQTLYMEALARDEMIFALGPAGTGKTYVAVAQAVS